MNRLVIFTVSLLLILSGIGGLLFIRSHQKIEQPGVKIVNIPICDENGVEISDRSIGLPDKVLDLTAASTSITKKEYKDLPKDTTFGRHFYTNASGLAVQASVVLMGRDRSSIHQPEFCLTVQGWPVDDSKTEIVPVRMERPYPYDLMVKKLTVSAKDGSGQTRSGLYVYWFVSKKNLTAQHGQRMLSMFNVLLKEGILERWAYVSYFTTCLPGGEDAAFQKLCEVIRDSVPSFQETAGNPIAGN